MSCVQSLGQSFARCRHCGPVRARRRRGGMACPDGRGERFGRLDGPMGTRPSERPPAVQQPYGEDGGRSGRVRPGLRSTARASERRRQCDRTGFVVGEKEVDRGNASDAYVLCRRRPSKVRVRHARRARRRHWADDCLSRLPLWLGLFRARGERFACGHTNRRVRLINVRRSTLFGGCPIVDFGEGRKCRLGANACNRNGRDNAGSTCRLSQGQPFCPRYG
jgi:hypothetical protein